MQKVLFIKHGALGDFILALGQMQTLAARHAKDDITLITTSVFHDMALQTGFFKSVVIDNRERLNLKTYYDVSRLIARSGFDVVYDLQKSRRTRKKYFTLVRLFLKKPLQWRYIDGDRMITRRLTPRFGPFLAKVAETEEPFSSNPSDLTFMRGTEKNFGQLPEKFLLFFPGCSPKHPYKRWSPDNYIALAKKAAMRNVACVVAGTGEERDVIEKICRGSGAVNFMDKASLFDIPALARRSLAVVGNDTGPAHMASYAAPLSVLLFSKITEASAKKFSVDGVHYMIGEHIDDTTPDDVWDILKTKIPQFE